MNELEWIGEWCGCETQTYTNWTWTQTQTQNHMDDLHFGKAGEAECQWMFIKMPNVSNLHKRQHKLTQLDTRHKTQDTRH